VCVEVAMRGREGGEDAGRNEFNFRVWSRANLKWDKLAYSMNKTSLSCFINFISSV
jgi:hypothetical protein